MRNTWGFDVSAGCSGFLYALNAGVKFVESGQYKKVLVIGSDVNSSMTDYTDRAVCIIFGDGAGAVMLEPAKEGEDGIIDHVAQVEGVGGQFLYMPGGGSLNPASHQTVDEKMHYIHQDGKNVFKYAVKKMAEMTERVLAKNGMTGKDVDCFIAHQANRRIITATAERLGMPLDKVIINIEQFRQYHGRNDSLGHADGARRKETEEGRHRAAGRRRRGIHLRRDVAALGLLAHEKR